MGGRRQTDRRSELFPDAFWDLECLTFPPGELRLGDADGVDGVDVSPHHRVAAGQR